jgi:hypothetical protein
MIRAVTAYVPIEGHPRTEQEYRRLGGKLEEAIGDRLMIIASNVKSCWLHKWLQDFDDVSLAGARSFTWSTADNPHKNSLEYHIVQAQKTYWLLEAMWIDPRPDVFVWIDYGIFSLPGVTAEIIADFLERAKTETAIAIPGCWEKDRYEYDDRWPCWRFCGGLMVVPREHVQTFHYAMSRECELWICKTRNVSWDVNTLARVEQNYPELPIRWYKANHDGSIFANYRAAEGADGIRELESRLS